MLYRAKIAALEEKIRELETLKPRRSYRIKLKCRYGNTFVQGEDCPKCPNLLEIPREEDIKFPPEQLCERDDKPCGNEKWYFDWIPSKEKQGMYRVYRSKRRQRFGFGKIIMG